MKSCMRIAASALVLAALSAPALAEFVYGPVQRLQFLSVAQLPTVHPETAALGPWAHAEHLEFTGPTYTSAASASQQSDLGPGYLVGVGISRGYDGDPIGERGVGACQQDTTAAFTITEGSPFLFAVATEAAGRAWWSARLTGPSGDVFALTHGADGFGAIDRAGMLAPGAYTLTATFGAGWDGAGVGSGNLAWSYRLEVPGPAAVSLLGLGGLLAARRRR